MTEPEQNSRNNRDELFGRIGVVATQVVLPIWLLVGAYFKLADLSPANLPVVLVKGLGSLGIDLNFVLRFSISVELIVVAIVWLLPQLSRLVSGVLLTCFMPILVGDMMLGAASCGCFGPVQVPPIVTFIIDGLLLVGVVYFGRFAPSLRMTPQLPLLRTLIAGVCVILSFSIAFGIDAVGVKTEIEVEDVTEEGPTVSLPAEGYYLPDYTTWEGRDWDSLDLASWVQDAPGDLSTGRHYVILFRKDCEHCHELLEVYFSGPLDFPATVIAVPERDGFPTEGVQEMPCEECRHAELPAGVDWFFNTPVLVRLQDGLVECAAEVSAEDPLCYAW